ncbi:hypothetical protein HYQ46_006651 [Verticillium longisporum]|nr:hypothetical protein HYQ46_006651 [Verticillium longisporum]
MYYARRPITSSYDSHGPNKGVECRAVRTTGHALYRSGPVDSHLVRLVPVLGPVAVRVVEDEFAIRGVGGGFMQVVQISHKDALELLAVGAAVEFARIVEDPLVVGELLDGGLGDDGSV